MSVDVNSVKESMDKAIDSLNHDLSKVRTGRANPSMLDSVKVEAYGALSPLNQVALVNVSEARQLTVKPFDPNVLADIEKAINAADLGLTPNNDGELIRLNIPALTEETRKVLVKDVKAYLEDCKVRIRNARHDIMNKIKKDEELTDDQKKGYEADVEAITKDYNAKAEEIAAKKEQDVMTI